jgi:hypothetical protein
MGAESVVSAAESQVFPNEWYLHLASESGVQVHIKAKMLRVKELRHPEILYRKHRECAFGSIMSIRPLSANETKISYGESERG